MDQERAGVAMQARFHDAAVGPDERQNRNIVALSNSIEGLQDGRRHLRPPIDDDGQGPYGLDDLFVFVEEMVQAVG